MNPLVILGIKALAVLAAIGALLWGIHTLDQSRQQIGYDRRVAEDNAALVQAQAEARAKERDLQHQKEVAQHEAGQRQIDNRRAADAARTADERLRLALDAIRAAGARHLPGDPRPAGTDATATLAELFGDCSAKYRGLAEAADGHANDARTLSEGWPR